MSIEETMNEANDYFVRELLMSNFTLLETTETHAVVSVGGYIFSIWATATGAEYLSTFDMARNAMELTFKPVQKEVLWCLLRNVWETERVNSLQIKIKELQTQLTK